MSVMLLVTASTVNAFGMLFGYGEWVKDFCLFVSIVLLDIVWTLL